MKVQVAVLGSLPLIVRSVSVDVKQHWISTQRRERDRTQLCESRGGRPGLPVPKSPYGLCGREATLKNRAQELCESPGGRPGLPVPESPYGLCGREATLKRRKTYSGRGFRKQTTPNESRGQTQVGMKPSGTEHVKHAKTVDPRSLLR